VGLHGSAQAEKSAGPAAEAWLGRLFRETGLPRPPESKQGPVVPHASRVGASLRLLFLARFPPRRDGTHGGSRAVAELLVRLAERQRVALIHLRGRRDGPADPALLEHCELLWEVARRPPARALSLLGRRLRVVGEVARGTPAAVAGSRSREFALVIREVAAAWRPDVVQLEYQLMGAYLPALASCPAARVLRQYEPGAATARDRAAHRSGLARLAGGLEERAWARFERSVMSRVHVVVALTDRDATPSGIWPAPRPSRSSRSVSRRLRTRSTPRVKPPSCFSWATSSIRPTSSPWSD
jgi:hypothetical protein